MQNIINGKWADSSDKKTMNIINPYTGKIVDTVPDSTEKDVKKAVEYAKKLSLNGQRFLYIKKWKF